MNKAIVLMVSAQLFEASVKKFGATKLAQVMRPATRNSIWVAPSLVIVEIVHMVVGSNPVTLKIFYVVPYTAKRDHPSPVFQVGILLFSFVL